MASEPVVIDLYADRNVYFEEDFSFIDKVLGSAVFKAEVRSVKDTTGIPVIDFSYGIGVIYSGTDTVDNHIAAGRLTTDVKKLINPATGNLYVGSDSILVSVLKVSMTTGSLAFAPMPSPSNGLGELGDDAEFYYDIVRTPSSGPSEILLRGRFIVRAGVSIP